MDLKEEKPTHGSPGLKAAHATSTYILSVRTLSRGLMHLHTEVGNVDSEPPGGKRDRFGGNSWHSPPHLPRPVVLTQTLTHYSFQPTAAARFRPSPPLMGIHSDSGAGFLEGTQTLVAWA